METEHPHDPDRNKHGRLSMVPDEAPDPVETRDPHSRPVPRRRRTAFLLAIPGLLLLVVGISWMLSRESRDAVQTFASESPVGTGGRTSGTDPHGGDREDVLNPAPAGPSVIADFELLADKDEYVGRAVELRAVKVLRATGPRTFWIGRFGNRTLVLLDGEAASARVEAGRHLRLSGTIERRPDGQQLAKLGLAEDDRKAIEDEDVVVRATRVSEQRLAEPRDVPALPSAPGPPR